MSISLFRRMTVGSHRLSELQVQLSQHTHIYAFLRHGVEDARRLSEEGFRVFLGHGRAIPWRQDAAFPRSRVCQRLDHRGNRRYHRDLRARRGVVSLSALRPDRSTTLLLTPRHPSCRHRADSAAAPFRRPYAACLLAKSLPISLCTHRAEFLEWNTTPVLPDEEAGATAAKVFPEFAK